MSIEIEVLNGDESWSMAETLFKEVWPPDVIEKLPWGHVKWADAELRALIEAPDGDLACHVGIFFRTVTWNGRKVHIGGIGGVSTLCVPKT
jgi:aminoglycoside 2'-N-acetyltransferase I